MSPVPVIPIHNAHILFGVKSIVWPVLFYPYIEGRAKNVRTGVGFFERIEFAPDLSGRLFCAFDFGPIKRWVERSDRVRLMNEQGWFEQSRGCCS